MKTIEPPADLICSGCGSSYFEYSHSRSMFDHESRRQIKVAQFICSWCGVYTPTRHLKSWDNVETLDTASTYVLPSGIFKGQLISDVADTSRGLRYLEKISSRDPNVHSFLEGLTKSE